MNGKVMAMIAGLALILAPPALADWDPGDDYKMHYPQMPDPEGWDVCLVCQWLADDFGCTETGPITDIHFWISWHADDVMEVVVERGVQVGLQDVVQDGLLALFLRLERLRIVEHLAVSVAQDVG